jgi:tetratricopeptide (TPR) repeat protein
LETVVRVCRKVILLLLALGVGACAHAPALMDLSAERSKKILASPPETPTQLLQRGWARLVRQNNLSGALEDFKKAYGSFAPDQGVMQALCKLGEGFVHLVRADLDAALTVFLEALEANPYSPEGLAAAVQLRELSYQIHQGHQRIAERLRHLLNSTPPLPPETARALRKILFEGATRKGAWPEANRVGRDMGIPLFWKIAHPLGRYPLVDFDSPFPPEQAPLASLKQPEAVPNWPEAGVLVLDGEGREGLAYAETFFKSRSTADLSLRIESDDPWTLFLDDVPLHTRASHRETLPRVVNLAFGAPAGWHRLVVKVPLRTQVIQLAVELTAADGRPAPVEWWTAGQATPDYPAGSRTKPVPATQIMRARLAERAGKHPDDPLAPLLAAHLDWEDGDLSAAKRHLATALERAPEFALPHYLLGLLLLDDPTIPFRIDMVRSRKHLQRALRLCPDMLLARFRLALLDMEEGKHLEALATLQELKARRPGAFIWSFFQGRIYEKLGWQLEAESAYRTALATVPDHNESLSRLLLRAIQNGAADDATRLANALEALGSWEPNLIKLRISRNQYERARALLEKIIRLFPASLAPRLTLFDLLIDREELQAAEKVIVQAERVRPRNPDVLERRADLLERLGKPDQAHAMRRRLVSVVPWDLRARLAWSVGSQTPGSIRLAGEHRFDASRVIAEYRSSGFRPGGNAVLVLDSTAIEVAPDGSSLERVHLIAQVLTPEGLEYWGEVKDVPANALVEEIRTIKTDGRQIDAEPIPGKETISLPALQVGDFVEVFYLQGVRGSGDAYIARRWYFRTPGMPIFRSRYSVAVPAGTELRVDAHGAAPQPSRRKEGDFDVRVWTRKNSPMILSEPNAPPTDEYTPFVQVGFGFGWRDARDRMRVALDRAARPTPELTRFAQESARDGSDDRRRLESLFRTVCTQVRQVGRGDDLSEPASHVLARREGNRLVLLTALLRILGYRPQVLLVRTAGNSQVGYQLPNRTTYRHGLAALEVDGQRLFLDPSNRYNTFGIVYPFLQGMRAMDITSAAGSDPFVRIPEFPRQYLAREIQLDLALSKDGTLQGNGHERITTSQAAQYRKLLTSLSPGQRQQVLQAGLGNYFSGAILVEHKITGLEDPDQPLLLEYRLRVPHFARRRGDTLVIQDGFYPYRLAASLIAKPERKLPLLLGDETRTDSHISLTLPKGAKARLSKPVYLQAPLSTFSLAVSQKGDRLIIEKALQVKAGRVPPKDYPTFRDFCQHVDRKDTEEIVIELAPSGA